MVKGILVTAMDFASRKGVKHTVYSYQRHGQWFVVKSGPKYSNVSKVTEFDDEGLKWLQSVEAPKPAA